MPNENLHRFNLCKNLETRFPSDYENLGFGFWICFVKYANENLHRFNLCKNV